MTLRECNDRDAEAVARVFRDAVLMTGLEGYSPAQVDAWARAADDRPAFAARLRRGVTLVAELGGSIVAFGQLDTIDHLDMIYCQPAQGRRGISSAIHAELERRARKCGVKAIHAEASKISRRFFEKHGYSAVEVERVVRFGSEFERFKMRKFLEPI
jgi:putative acetyltransferase